MENLYSLSETLSETVSSILIRITLPLNRMFHWCILLSHIQHSKIILNSNDGKPLLKIVAD